MRRTNMDYGGRIIRAELHGQGSRYHDIYEE